MGAPFAFQVNLTDGRTVQLGCVNTTDGHTGCIPGQLDAGIRAAAFHFAPGERVTALSLFAGPDNRGNANARAGAIRFSTSLVRRTPRALLCGSPSGIVRFPWLCFRAPPIIALRAPGVGPKEVHCLPDTLAGYGNPTRSS